MKKIIIALMIFILIISTNNIFAIVPTYTNDAKFNRGVGNCCYYIDNTASAYTSTIDSAMYNWEVTGYGWNPIYVTGVSSNYATHIDFYAYYSIYHNVLDMGVYAYTSFWDINGNVICNDPDITPTYDYFYTEITLNEDFSYSHSQRVITHEIGHAFGLNHTNQIYSIMYVPINYGIVDTVQQNDHDTINYLYN